MGLEHRPFVGTWRLSQRKVVQHTPDAIVYINGDTSLPGCQKCNSKIDIQKFVTSISVDAGTDAAGASSTITMAIPTHHLDSFSRDSQFILHPGLEVHVYMRGYFPVKGMYSNLTTSDGVMRNGQEAPASFITQGGAFVTDQPQVLQGPTSLEDLPPSAQDALRKLRVYGAPLTEAQQKNAALIYQMFRDAGYAPAWGIAGAHQASFESNLTETSVNWGKNGKDSGLPVAMGLFQINVYGGLGNPTPGFEDGKRAGTPEQVAKQPDKYWNGLDPELNVKREIFAINTAGLRGPAKNTTRTVADQFRTFYTSSTGAGGKPKDDPLRAAAWQKNVDSRMASGQRYLGALWEDAEFSKRVLMEESQANAAQVIAPEVPQAPTPVDGSDAVVQPQWQPSMLDDLGLTNMDLESLLAYPYYHVFHGVVTTVSHAWSAGNQTVTLQCSSMLHFWSYHQMSSNASVFGARPQNSKARVSLIGHNFTGMHPYEIVYTLHHDTAGSAGGIAWHLSQKTNQEARSPITGESLFSLNLRYWQQRFNKREIKLRLHGATGGLFNSAQAAFLSRLKGHQITDLLKNRYSGAGRPGTGDILSAAATLGLMRPVGPAQRQRLLEYLNFGRSNDQSPGADKPSFELNLAEMIAFVSDISKWGQVQLFESTYESKMDIVQKVCEVTGFEFYQDVDGDFVFKPPMYNLDTSSSRVYRLEDIDIISINFEEKEPNCTYMTVKGTPFKNLLGHGVEGEWGVQGQYIDYRLVAQFGWRKQDYETSYFNDPRSMFFMAMNRLDILNAPTKTATVTIPIRPELRPGYPCYIPYLDCFYYCPGFAHSYQVGGQCSTTLQLIGKRGKFFAPGDPSRIRRTQAAGGVVGGIDAIQLGYPAFPPTPLETQDAGGQLRLTGFPNVVMALDPSQINPVFFLVGSDIGDLNSNEAITGLLRMAVDLNILTVRDKGDPGPEYRMSADNGNDIVFWFPKDGDTSTMPSNAQSIWVMAEQYTARQTAFSESQMQTRTKLEGIQQKITDAENQLSQISKAEREQEKGKEKDLTSQKDKVKLKLQVLEAEQSQCIEQFEEAKSDFDSRMSDVGQTGNAAYLAQLVRRTGDVFFKDPRFGPGYKDPNATATLLDMLSDKKAGLTNGSVPGMYRYYSASHPAKEHQGQPIVRLVKTDTVKNTTTQEPFIGDDWKDVKIPTFVSTREIQVQPGGILPQAMLEERRPTWGLKVLTNRIAGGEVLPTSEIRELMFSVHEIHVPSPKVKTVKGSYTVDVGLSMTGKVRDQLRALAAKAILTDTPRLVFGDWVSTLGQDVQAAVTEANLVGGGSSSSMKDITFPDMVETMSGIWPSDTSLSAYQLADNPDGEEELFDGSPAVNSSRVWDGAAWWLAEEMTRRVRDVKDEWLRDTQAVGASFDVSGERLSVFTKVLGAKYGTESSKQTVKTSVREPPKRATPVYMPVFPVSDARGYTVTGSYRYGRDVDINPSGVFDVLAKQDPLTLLDRRLVEEAVDVVTRGKDIMVEVPVLDANGQPKVSPSGAPLITKRKVSGTDAVKEVERKVLLSLRDHLSDQQILDLGLARATGNPTVLEFGLMNWLTDKAKDGVHQIPMVNAGYSMAELTATQNGPTCTCRATEADVLLQLAGRQDFVQVSMGNSQPSASSAQSLDNRGLDDVTRVLIESSMTASMDWKMSQEALRGSVTEQRSSLVSTITNLDDAYENWQRQSRAARQQLDQAVEDV